MSEASEARKEILREGYERFNAGEIEWLLDQLDPEAVWEEAPEVPGARAYEGREGARRFLESFERLWESIRFEPVELRASGERVIAFCRLVGRGRSSGADVSQRVGHVWDFSGLRVTRVRTFLDWGHAAEAVGIEPPEGGIE